MSVSRLKNVSLIGVEQIGSLADTLDDPGLLRLENLDTDPRVIFSNEPLQRLEGIGRRFRDALL